MSSVSNGLYFLTLPLVSVMRVIYRKIRHARYQYIKRNVEKVWGARYLSKNTVISSVYGVNLNSTLLDKILNVVDKSDMSVSLLKSVLSPFL